MHGVTKEINKVKLVFGAQHTYSRIFTLTSIDHGKSDLLLVDSFCVKGCNSLKKWVHLFQMQLHSLEKQICGFRELL